MAEEIQRNNEVLAIFKEQYPNNVRFASVFRCLSDIHGMQQRDLYERQKAAVQSFI
jgi:hypothetical protein